MKKHYIVNKSNKARQCYTCGKKIKKREKSYYYVICWQDIVKKVYCHIGCDEKEEH